MWVKKILVLTVTITACATALAIVKGFTQPQKSTNQPNKNITLNTRESTPSSVPPEPTLIEPVDGFKSRVTKKPFGIYITPSNSPVQPERFTGYHMGADAEFADVGREVQVRAITDGKVLYANLGSGYGGVMSVRHQIGTETITAIYGHLKPDSMLTVGTEVKKGQQIGILGQGYSHETDGERKHLHFGIHKGAAVDLRGYVATKAELIGWEDPQEVFNQFSF